MHQGPYEIVVLKPTTVFLSFLASQLPENKLPSLKTLQTDNTAYVLHKQDTDEATLDEIEKHFTQMFRHEICRWLGQDARNDIETSFLDFLCCFKFELHSHIILMEPTIDQGRQMLKISPRSVLMNWIKSSVEDEQVSNVLERVNLANLVENATVIVKNFSSLKEIKPYLTKYYKPIFETAMSRMSGEQDQWPVMSSFQAFTRYFAVEIHTQLIYLHY